MTSISNPQKSKRAERQEIFLPVTGFVWLYPEEIKVINHPMFQRLGRINQLGQTFLVYRGATHKRFEHTLGTLHIIQRMIDAITYTCAKYKIPKYREKNGNKFGARIQRSEMRFIRLGALLHDIGHIAYGHSLEDELCILNKHDSDERFDIIFESIDETWLNENGKTLAELIDKIFNIYIPDDLQRKGFKASEIIRLLIRRHPKNPKKDKYREKKNILEKAPSMRFNICRDMIGNTICADLLDYLHRDWYYIGKHKPFDERILQYMEIYSEKETYDGDPKPSSKDEFVISIGKEPKLRSDAVSAILQLLEWRYQLAESVLFHRTKLAATAMLDRALMELWAGLSEKREEEFFLPFSDEQMIIKCKNLATKQLKKKSPTYKKGYCKVAKELFTALEKRQLFTLFKTYTRNEFNEDHLSNILKMYAESETNPDRPSKNRTDAMRILERDFKLEPGSLVMYCPAEKMNSKIAEVNIKVNDTVDKFNAYEDKHGPKLSGGHLEAQLKRFQDLWKVHFFIKRGVKEKISRSDLENSLKNAISHLVLNKDNSTKKTIRKGLVAKDIAAALIANESSPWYGYKLRKKGKIARSNDGSKEIYPTGFQPIRSYIEKSKT